MMESTTYDSMAKSWRHHAKQSKSEKHKLCELSHMRNMKKKSVSPRVWGIIHIIEWEEQKWAGMSSSVTQVQLSEDGPFRDPHSGDTMGLGLVVPHGPVTARGLPQGRVGINLEWGNSLQPGQGLKKPSAVTHQQPTLRSSGELKASALKGGIWAAHHFTTLCIKSIHIYITLKSFYPDFFMFSCHK